MSFHAVWMAAVQLAVSGLLFERDALRWPTAVEAGALAHMAVFVTVVAFVAWYTALDRLGADRAGLLVGTVAVTALATSALVGTATVTPVTVSGCALVAGGVAVGVRYASGRSPAEVLEIPACLPPAVTGGGPQPLQQRLIPMADLAAASPLGGSSGAHSSESRHDLRHAAITAGIPLNLRILERPRHRSASARHLPRRRPRRRTTRTSRVDAALSDLLHDNEDRTD